MADNNVITITRGGDAPKSFPLDMRRGGVTITVHDINHYNLLLEGGYKAVGSEAAPKPAVTSARKPPPGEVATQDDNAEAARKLAESKPAATEPEPPDESWKEGLDPRVAGIVEKHKLTPDKVRAVGLDGLTQIPGVGVATAKAILAAVDGDV